MTIDITFGAVSFFIVVPVIVIIIFGTKVPFKA
jgi:hypothetical protein